MTQKIPLDLLLMLNSSVMLLYAEQQLVWSGTLTSSQLLVYSVWVGLLIGCGYLYWNGSPYRQLHQLQGWLSKTGLPTLAGILGTAILALDLFTLPVNAQTTGGTTGSSAGFFFANLQTKVTSVFANSAQANTVNPLVLFTFGILQILFIMLVAWQIAKVVQASRDEEDWRQVAKTPIIVVLAVVGGDWAIGLI